MRKKYVQLPPLPLDLPLESIEIIWEYAKMSDYERKKIQKFMRETLNNSQKYMQQAKQEKAKNPLNVESSPDIAKFTSLMQQMVKTLIVQACEMAAIVYQYYSIDGKSIKEISEMFNVSQNIIQLMAQYYERKMK